VSDDWYQQALTPPQVVELSIRLGCITETDHLQVMVQLYDPVTKVQIAQASVPHMPVAQHEEALAWAVSRGLEWLRETIEPF
jgi:PIN domain nuclease of toxin-antitoxin system